MEGSTCHQWKVIQQGVVRLQDYYNKSSLSILLKLLKACSKNETATYFAVEKMIYTIYILGMLVLNLNSSSHTTTLHHIIEWVTLGLIQVHERHREDIKSHVYKVSHGVKGYSSEHCTVSNDKRGFELNEQPWHAVCVLCLFSRLLWFI